MTALCLLLRVQKEERRERREKRGENAHLSLVGYIFDTMDKGRTEMNA